MHTHTHKHTSQLEDSTLLVPQSPDLSAMLTRVTEMEVRERGAGSLGGGCVEEMTSYNCHICRLRRNRSA